MRRSFSTTAVSEITGATVRQIDYWARTGLLRPSGRDAAGRGSSRRYTFQDIIAIQTIGKLRQGNCALQKIRAAVQYLRKHYSAASSAAALARQTLLTDGKVVYLLSSEKEVMEVLTRHTVWSVPLGRLILDIQAKIDRMPTLWIAPVRVRGRAYHLDVVEDEESGGFHVQCRELPGAIEQGRTAAEAVRNGQEAIESVLDYDARRERQQKAGLLHVKAG